MNGEKKIFGFNKEHFVFFRSYFEFLNHFTDFVYKIVTFMHYLQLFLNVLGIHQSHAGRNLMVIVDEIVKVILKLRFVIKG